MLGTTIGGERKTKRNFESQKTSLEGQQTKPTDFGRAEYKNIKKELEQ